MTDGAHSHATDPAIAALTARVISDEAFSTALSARITALENAKPLLTLKAIAGDKSVSLSWS